MKKIFFLVTFFSLVLVAYTPPLAHAEVCRPDGAPCGNGGTCRVDPEGTFYCAPAGTPGLTPSNSNTAGSINQTYLTFYKDLVTKTVNDYLVPVLIAISFIVFLWGVFNYFVYGADDETKRKEGKQFVLWGIIGFVIIFSVWGLVNIVKSTIIPSGNNNVPAYPKL